jgi:transposase
LYNYEESAKKMRINRKRPFSQTQIKALELLRTTDQRVVDIAKMLNVHYTTLYLWMRKFDELSEEKIKSLLTPPTIT